MAIGISTERATELLSTVATPKVRMKAIGGAQHRSTAVLKEVQGDHAIVLPHGHRRTERIPLSDLSEWKAANESGHKRKTPPPKGKPQRQPRLPYQSVQHGSGTEQATKHVVFSRKQKGMFGGTKRRWTSQTTMCIQYETEAGAKRSAAKLRRNSESDDAEVMTVVAGRQLAIELHQKEPESKVVEEEKPSVSFPFDQFAGDLLEPSIASILSLDFERMQSLDAGRFTAAMDKRTKAISDLLEVKDMMVDAINAVKAADAEVREAARSVLVSGDIDLAEANGKAKSTAEKQTAPKITVKAVVEGILLEEPNSLFKKHLVTKVVDTGISKAKHPRTSVGIAIGKMIENGIIKVNGNKTLQWVGDGA